jgi:hypothetical protein
MTATRFRRESGDGPLPDPLGRPAPGRRPPHVPFVAFAAFLPFDFVAAIGDSVMSRLRLQSNIPCAGESRSVPGISGVPGSTRSRASREASLRTPALYPRSTRRPFTLRSCARLPLPCVPCSDRARREGRTAAASNHDSVIRITVRQSSVHGVGVPASKRTEVEILYSALPSDAQYPHGDFLPVAGLMPPTLRWHRRSDVTMCQSRRRHDVSLRFAGRALPPGKALRRPDSGHPSERGNGTAADGAVSGCTRPHARVRVSPGLVAHAASPPLGVGAAPLRLHPLLARAS